MWLALGTTDLWNEYFKVGHLLGLGIVFLDLADIGLE